MAGNFLKSKNQNEVTVEAKPNTLEMDGLFTQEDIDNAFYVMGQCLTCNEWNRLDTRNYNYKCIKCGGETYNMRESRSIRTWLTTKDVKKTRTAKNKKTIDNSA